MDSESAASDTTAPQTAPQTETETETATVTAHTTCPDRVVFIERGNRDGWIATGHAVDCER